MKIAFKVLFFLFFLFSNVFSSSVSGKELSKLANSKFKVQHFFFYSKEIKKSFLFTKGSKGVSLYYFRPDGIWEPVSNALEFRDLPSAPKQFGDVSFDVESSTVSFGEFVGDINAPSKDPLSVKHTKATITTNKGDITLELYDDIAPKTVENFIFLSELKKYDGLIFHRIIKDFMIQGGDPQGNGTGSMSKWGKAFEDEIDPKVTFNKPYLLAMANSGPNTNGSQFFITLASTVWLDGKHTIFGKVISGKDVVDLIGSVKVDDKNKPIDDVKILKIRITP
ncbi:Peptidyl-prolyl cis-trans isomerase [hydrothermal vent metagenome]|uniref:peptidylprolyl isomerase n=1 Tax=hydrothermal vent metagenome TaxID=652676 RepID=A0A3B1E081_9ZZZZ